MSEAASAPAASVPAVAAGKYASATEMTEVTPVTPIKGPPPAEKKDSPEEKKESSDAGVKEAAAGAVPPPAEEGGAAAIPASPQADLTGGGTAPDATPVPETPQSPPLTQTSLLRETSAFSGHRERTGRRLRFVDDRSLPDARPLVETTYSESLHYASIERNQGLVEVKAKSSCCTVS